MSLYAGHIRDEKGMAELEGRLSGKPGALSRGYRFVGSWELYDLLKSRDIALTQLAVLSAMRAAAARTGTRGSALVTEEGGERYIPRCPATHTVRTVRSGKTRRSSPNGRTGRSVRRSSRSARCLIPTAGLRPFGRNTAAAQAAGGRYGMADGILLAGEAMGLLTALEEGPLEKAETFRSAVAGAEFNVAVGLCRLGIGRPISQNWGRPPLGAGSERRCKLKDFLCGMSI